MFALKPFERPMALLPRTELFGWMPEEFSRFFTEWPVLETPEELFRYPLTMEEKEKEFIIRVELPGFTPEEVKVELKGEQLMVEAEHKEPEEQKTEREYAHVKRTLTLPPTVKLEKAEATYRNGVLEVHLPRRPEEVGRRIEVKT